MKSKIVFFFQLLIYIFVEVVILGTWRWICEMKSEIFLLFRAWMYWSVGIIFMAIFTLASGVVIWQVTLRLGSSWLYLWIPVMPLTYWMTSEVLYHVFWIGSIDVDDPQKSSIKNFWILSPLFGAMNFSMKEEAYGDFEWGRKNIFPFRSL